jgi:Fe/S biogenesis protein NfuA
VTTPPSPFAGTDSPTSPFAEGGLTADNLIVEITEAANVKLKELRDLEPETDRLGLRVEIVSGPGEDFRYDLSFEIVTQAAFTDEVRTVDGLKIIVPANSIDLLSGSILDYNDTQGLIIRNPNKPLAAAVEGLIADDALASSIQDILSSEVNPALAAHGGFVSFVGHDGEGVAYLTMGGGCHGCSMSRMTMLEGVQTTLIEKVPGVVKVRDLTDHTSGENPYYT